AIAVLGDVYLFEGDPLAGNIGPCVETLLNRCDWSERFRTELGFNPSPCQAVHDNHGIPGFAEMKGGGPTTEAVATKNDNDGSRHNSPLDATTYKTITTFERSQQ